MNPSDLGYGNKQNHKSKAFGFDRNSQVVQQIGLRENLINKADQNISRDAVTVYNNIQGQQTAGFNSSSETPYQPVTAITENNTHEFDVSMQHKVAASAMTNDYQDTLQN